MFKYEIVQRATCVHAPLAQLDRVFGYEPKGRGFESLTACQKNTGTTIVVPVFFCPTARVSRNPIHQNALHFDVMVRILRKAPLCSPLLRAKAPLSLRILLLRSVMSTSIPTFYLEQAPPHMLHCHTRAYDARHTKNTREPRVFFVIQLSVIKLFRLIYG